MPWPGHNSKTGLSQELNDHFELFLKIAKAGKANMGSSGFLSQMQQRLRALQLILSIAFMCEIEFYLPKYSKSTKRGLS